MASSLIGEFLGQYEVIELLGKGGMASVYLGHQASIDRQVAIKVMSSNPGLDEQFIERFKLEARTIGNLQHPHILPLYDYGSTADNVLYLVMAYVDGGSLEDLIEMGKVPLKRAEKVIREIASALDYAHRHGVIHRDIKPANILLASEGHALLADFGIVKMSEGGTNLTGTGLIGTPAYMAPEQGQGLPIDSRADIYALGVIAWELLTGKQPYNASTPMQVLIQHINEPVPRILEVDEALPPGLDFVMHKVLTKNPEERYQSAIEFAEDFTEAIHNNADSIFAARAASPIKSGATEVFSKDTIQMNNTDSQPHDPQPTIIMQEKTNPLLILAGFGLIALVIVVIAVLLIQQNSGDDNGVVGVATDDTTQVALIAEVTDTPTPSPTSSPTPSPTPLPTYGALRYNTVNNMGDTINLRVSGLDRPASGNQYVAWLINTADNSTLSLGRINLDALGDSVLAFTDETGRFLPTFYNAVIITEETEIGDTPSDTIVYHGVVDTNVSRSLQAIFTEDERGIDGGSLLNGALREAATAKSHAGLAAGATSLGSMKTHAEHTINILRGGEEDFDGSGRGANPGQGIGIFFFLDAIRDELDTIVQSPNASIQLQIQVDSIGVCVNNVRAWAEQVVELEIELAALEEDLESVQGELEEATQLANFVIEGQDFNGNGFVEPFEEECGLNQILEFGVQVGNLEIIEGALDITVVETDE